MQQNPPTQRLTVAILGEPGGYAELARALEHAGGAPLVTADPAELFEADGLIIAGHTSSVETYKTFSSFDAARIVGRRVAGGRPVLAAGAAFGMFFERIREHSQQLGAVEISAIAEWPGVAVPLAEATAPLGVYELEAARESELLHNLPGPLRYKAHHGVLEWSFDQSIDYMSPPAVSWTKTTPPYLAAVENGPLTAVQFCPVASGAAGEEFLRRWVGSLPVTGRLQTHTQTPHHTQETGTTHGQEH